MARLKVGDAVELEVRLSDERPPPPGGWTALYLHGFGSRQAGDKASFFRERLLEEDIPFCSFDFRGHGASGGELGELTFSRNLEDVARVRSWLAERGHERIILFGSSMGGAIALAAAALAPSGVAACLLIAPAVGMAAGLERWAGPDRLERWQREGRIRYESALVATDLAWEVVADLRRWDFRSVARDLAVPTLIVQGGRDASVAPRDVLEFVAATRPGIVDLVLWGDGDHRLLERKGEIWQRMRSFLERRGLLGLERAQEPPAPGGDTIVPTADRRGDTS